MPGSFLDMWVELSLQLKIHGEEARCLCSCSNQEGTKGLLQFQRPKMFTWVLQVCQKIYGIFEYLWASKWRADGTSHSI